MAEYIDRTELEPDTEWSEYEDDFVSYSQAQIARMEPADVIEHSKINKAIEEIEKIIEGGNHADDYLDGFDDGVENAIEILKRNIGE